MNKVYRVNIPVRFCANRVELGDQDIEVLEKYAKKERLSVRLLVAEIIKEYLLKNASGMYEKEK